MRPNIVITGLDRSGTTLMHLLMKHGFLDVEITDGEAPALQIEVETESQYLCSKKTYDLQFMDVIVDELKAKIIWMVRDPRDCIVSRAPMNKYREYWQRPSDLMVKLRPVMRLFWTDEMDKLDEHILMIEYERLLIDSDAVQDEIASFLGLTKSLSFSRCHTKFVEEQSLMKGKYLERLNGVRPLDATNVGNWMLPEHDEWWRKIYNDGEQHKMILFLVNLFGYERDDRWLDRHIDVICLKSEDKK